MSKKSWHEPTDRLVSVIMSRDIGLVDSDHGISLLYMSMNMIF